MTCSSEETHEGPLVAGGVSSHLRPSRVEELTRTTEGEIIPMTRSLKGFQDQIVLVESRGLEAIDLTFWDPREDGEAYGRSTYREVMKALAKVVDGPPRIETRDVSNSTFHKIRAHVAP